MEEIWFQKNFSKTSAKHQSCCVSHCPMSGTAGCTSPSRARGWVWGQEEKIGFGGHPCPLCPQRCQSLGAMLHHHQLTSAPTKKYIMVCPVPCSKAEGAANYDVTTACSHFHAVIQLYCQGSLRSLSLLLGETVHSFARVLPAWAFKATSQPTCRLTATVCCTSELFSVDQ